jgi:Epoxide hydrolase N terminus
LATEYDWRACEARLNALPQFTTEIDRVDIYFIHVKSGHPGALPLIITCCSSPASRTPAILGQSKLAPPASSYEGVRCAFLAADRLVGPRNLCYQ